MKVKPFICTCNNPMHQVIFYYDDEDNMLYITPTLNKEVSFWKRISIAWKYIFKRDSPHFEEILLEKEKIDELMSFLKKETP